MDKIVVRRASPVVLGHLPGLALDPALRAAGDRLQGPGSAEEPEASGPCRRPHFVETHRTLSACELTMFRSLFYGTHGSSYTVVYLRFCNWLA